MADDAPATPAKENAPARRPRKRTAPAAEPTAEPAPKAAASAKKEDAKIPRRADLSAPMRTLLSVRRTLDRQRPIFGRQAANRYYRIGRDGAWRRPRGLQSKQRRHYGYRAQIVSIGYRSPARVRGLVPSGFAPVIVHTTDELQGIDARRQAAIIARTVGTRRRLVLEEEARKLGIRVLNPIVKANAEA
ncbi:MAG TPA: 50S ribosomal protein L32e [Thermoplasmata archaeon]|nr:50S ribosomal protein L32e [Thermoplasmata archaeon]